MPPAKLPRYKQDFFINGRHFGSGMRYGRRPDGLTYQPRGRAFFCPVCATVWAVCPVMDTMTQQPSEFESVAVPCASHDQRYGKFPGSVWCSWDHDFNDCFPDEVIRYEFTQSLKTFKDYDDE